MRICVRYFRFRRPIGRFLKKALQEFGMSVPALGKPWRVLSAANVLASAFVLQKIDSIRRPTLTIYPLSYYAYVRYSRFCRNDC